ncbi:hypothetical protein AC1031_020074 [Aphanomyces cochlioides]|nr:hypothetical protein AC1031_020074 [Aphanomyces cochlioides]
MHLNSADSSIQMLTSSGQAMLFPQSLDDAYKSDNQTNVTTKDLCVSACSAKGNYAGVVYSSSTKLCTFNQPKVATDFPELVSGWVNPAVYNVDNGSVQYSKMPTSSLPKTYVSSTMPNMASVDACASTLSLINKPSAPVSFTGVFDSELESRSLSATTSMDCYKLCIPSQNNFFASVFDSNAKTCAYYSPTSTLLPT